MKPNNLKSQQSRIERCEQGYTVVANGRRGVDTKLIRWGCSNDLITPIDRGTKWVNPFEVERHTRAAYEHTVAQYRAWLPSQAHLMATLDELRGRVLECCCHPWPCHGDVLTELVNGSPLFGPDAMPSVQPTPTQTAVTPYDLACRALAEAKSADEVMEVRSKADALRHYARRAKNKQLEIDAAEIRLRAERRLGAMLREQKETGGLAKGGQPYQATGSVKEPVAIPTLADVGIDKKLSSQAQRLAALPTDKFEAMVDEWRGRVSKESERVTLKLIKEEDRKASGIVSTERSIERKRHVVLTDDLDKFVAIIRQYYSAEQIVAIAQMLRLNA
jgi:hypothetical protein